MSAGAKAAPVASIAVPAGGARRHAPAKLIGYAAMLIVGVVAPFVFPAYTNQMTVLWLMVIFAITWDVMGGQMGYNSLGNIFFFGMGVYACAVVQVGLWTDVGDYTRPDGLVKYVFTPREYYLGIALGILVAGFFSSLFAYVFGWIVFGLRGPYFAIGTLAFAIAAAELISTWNWVGAGGGMAMPNFPGHPDQAKLFYYVITFAIAVASFIFFKWLYSTRFGLAMNAIRDDEDKAAAMGLHTNRYKQTAWALSAFFLGLSGAVFGNLVGFIDPRNVAFPTVTFGVFMVLMVLLGGKGTIWGPIVGAIVFHVIKEVTWTYFLGWQFVALGALIVVIVIFFEQGIVGWVQEKKPEWFGVRVDPKRENVQRAEAAE